MGLIDQDSIKPTRKVQSTAIGVPAGLVIVYALGLLGVKVPSEIAVALGSLLSGVLAYFTKEQL